MEQTQTYFASAARASAGELARQARNVQALENMAAAFEAVNDQVLVLNAQRQIVYANRNAMSLLGNPDLPKVLGQRPGEALGCARANECSGGCGTSKFCSTCGAVKAILTAQSGRPDISECSIIRRDDLTALDLQVRTAPIVIEGQDYTVCCIRDISHEKRRRVLERIFFHDVLNTATGMLLLADRVSGDHAQPNDRRRLGDLVATVVGQIVEQRDLMAAETSELAVRPEPFAVRGFLDGVVQLYLTSPVCEKRWILLEQCPELTIVSDRNLLGRVLGNLVKNALEASPENATVDISAAAVEGGVEFSVHNEGVIPPEVQLQLFQRSFSTKGANRGLGTYSVRLLTERYLRGRVSLTSTPQTGTTFRIRLPLAPST